MVTSAKPRTAAGRRREQVQPSRPLADLFGRRQVHAEVTEQSDDDETRTAQTVGLMARYTREDSTSPIVHRAALDAIALLPERDAAKEAAAVWRWIRDRVTFRDDSDLAAAAGISGVDTATAEVLIRPVDILTMPHPVGDCDDYSMLAAAMLRALGIPSRFRTIAADQAEPENYSHIYVVAETPEGEIPLDASHGPRPGWQAPAVGKTRDWSIDPMSAGLGFAERPWWQTAINTGIKTTGNILTTRYAVPPAGTFVSGPEGTYYRQTGGGGVPYLPLDTGFGLGSMLPWIIGIGALFLIAKR